MESISKIALDARLAEAVVARHFGSSTRLRSFEELKEGLFNAAALLELGDGTRLVLKAAPPDAVRVLRYERDILRAEVEAMRRVRAETRVPVPEILVHDTSRGLLASDFFVMTFLPGVPFNRLRGEFSASAQAEIDREMGRLTRELSTITHGLFGYWSQPEPAGCTWRECFANMVRGILLDGEEAGVDLEMEYAEIERRMAEQYGVLEEIRVPRLVHWDLWDGNIFVDPQSGKITGLIDFERVLWGDPLTEGIFVDRNPQSQAVEGYGREILASPDSRMRRLLYNIYLHLIMVIECTYRRYPTPEQENWIRPVLAEELSCLG
jgi:aminoglycoside phosphotransferase (APT) family kinase protein